MRKWILGLLVATVGLAAAGSASAGDCFFDRHDHRGGYGRTYAGYRGAPYGGYGGYGAGYGAGYGSGCRPGGGYGGGGYYAPAPPTAYYPAAPYRSAYVSTPRLSIGFGY